MKPSVRDERTNIMPFNEIVGTNMALLQVFRQIEAVAPTDSTVLITGETGTGKELFARSIHRMSLRSRCPFVSVDCATLTSTLNCSGSFDPESGACLVAKQFWDARFESACTGTIFLDQISELPPDAQIALLAVLEERELERNECMQLSQTGVRIVAATNFDIAAEMENGRFRSDLFYRLNVFPVELPPLRARRDDIPTLAEYFVKLYACRLYKDAPSIDEKTMELLQSYHWPGNIRELQNIVERSVIVTEGEVLSVDDAWFLQQPLELQGRTEPYPVSKTSRHAERRVVDAALAKCRERISDDSGGEEKPEPASMTREDEVNASSTSKSRFRYLN